MAFEEKEPIQTPPPGSRPDPVTIGGREFWVAGEGGTVSPVDADEAADTSDEPLDQGER
jgi:hypothetical protein